MIGREPPCLADGVDLPKGKMALSIENLRCARTRTDERRKIALCFAQHIHRVGQEIDWILHCVRPAARLVGGDEVEQCEEKIILSSALSRVSLDEALHLGQGSGVAFIISDGAKHQTVSGSIRSYSACVPMNLMSANWRR